MDDERPHEAGAGAASPLNLLLARCALGDQIAFRRLYDSQSPRLYGLALRLTRQPTLAADAVHDAFLQVWQKSARFDPSRGSAETWLASLVRYRTIDVLRRRRREQTGYEIADDVDPDPGPLERLLETTEGAALHRCLQTLEEGHRRVLLLAFVDGLSHSELASRVQAPLGTVKSWIRRGLQGLKRCLEP